MQLNKTIKPLMMLLPLLEIAGFIIVGRWIGVLATLMLIVFTTIVGLFVLRFQGLMTLAQMHRRMSAGEHPAVDALGSALLMFGGLLLLIPGFITDTMGVLLLIPTIRSLIIRWLYKSSILQPSVAPGGKKDTRRVIDAEFHREDDTLRK